MGESGTGKSHSIKNLNPEETFIINVLNKPLPFKGFKKKYRDVKDAGAKANYLATDDTTTILNYIERISNNRPDIKTLIIDDFQYVMANQFLTRALEQGYKKFTEIGQSAWKIIRQSMSCRDDLYVFILSHTEIDSLGRSKCKTIGKMLDEKITLEGMFTVVLHSLVHDGHYKFLTKNDGSHIAKSPLAMFDEQLIDNDLQEIKQKINLYLDEDIDFNQHIQEEAA